MKSMKNSKSGFEGFMIHNRAEKYPLGMQLYVRYCIHTSSEPLTRQSTTVFTCVGQVKFPSLRKVSVRIPIGESLFLDFDVDMIDQNIPLIFGLEHHMKRRCS